MSVVAVKVYDDKIQIAADSIVCRGDSKRVDDNFTKLVNINDMIIGCCGSCEEASLLYHYAETHKPLSTSEKDILAFIIEFSKWKNDLVGSPSINNEYVIVFDGHAFIVVSMFVNEVKTYAAIGAGLDFANAALYLEHSPKESVKVACALFCYVAEPIIEYEVKLGSNKNKNKNKNKKKH